MSLLSLCVWVVFGFRLGGGGGVVRVFVFYCALDDLLAVVCVWEVWCLL